MVAQPLWDAATSLVLDTRGFLTDSIPVGVTSFTGLGILKGINDVYKADQENKQIFDQLSRTQISKNFTEADWNDLAQSDVKLATYNSVKAWTGLLLGIGGAIVRAPYLGSALVGRHGSIGG